MNFLKNNNNFKLSAFTLVELIVVIVILAILSTIAFLSFNTYSSSARDSLRVTSISDIQKGLELYNLNAGNFPQPENISGTGVINGITLNYVGEISNLISRKINISSSPKDPLSNNDYIYGTTFDYKNYQIATVLENSQTNNKIIELTYADNGNRAKVSGNYNGLIKFSSGSIKYIINLPGLIFNSGGTIDIINQEPYFIINNYDNLPYKLTSNSIINNKTKIETIKELTGKDVILTGVIINETQDQLDYLSNLLGYDKILVGKKIFGEKYIMTIVNLKKLGIYYGYPSSLNNVSNGYQLDKVVNDLNKFDTIILGEGLEKIGHSDHINTQNILSGGTDWYGTRQGYKGEPYGYISLMQSTGSIFTSVDEWKALGIKGIFLDEAGYDYLIPTISSIEINARIHQNDVINYIHQKGLKIIINSWNVDDVFGTLNGEAISTINSNDSYLMESFVYNWNVAGFYDYDNQLIKINSAKNYKNNLGIKLYCVGLLPNFIDITQDRINTMYSKSLSSCDYIQITEKTFGATNPILNSYY
ncbi:MAG: type II secretion system protein [Candidatus Gracilibacteria bacterium]|nr:type II secretion system protein [Candidatus Gracilibacteria bacterium]MDD2908954.1 type II secretion system protein [Candidatus Gracilibacteria bacterium]